MNKLKRTARKRYIRDIISAKLLTPKRLNAMWKNDLKRRGRLGEAKMTLEQYYMKPNRDLEFAVSVMAGEV